jgi:hypothetical protein
LLPATCLLPLHGAAEAAEVTDMAPELGLLGGFEYSGDSTNGKLVEADTVVAGRHVVRHTLDLALEFAPVAGFALTLDLEITPSYTQSFTDSAPMLVDPLDGSGSYLAGEPLADPTVIKASGLSGMWFGVALAPFSEDYERVQNASWRLDAAIRTPSPNRNLWTAVDGKRGAAPGGAAIDVSGAFSTDRGVGNPWVRAQFVKETKQKVDFVDEGGVTWAEDVEVRPASTFEMKFGVELLGYEDRAVDSRFSVDLWMGGAYRTWEDISSGVYLPNVVDSARSIAVTAGDSIHGLTGVALDYHVNAHVRMRSGLELGVATPYTLEHVYPVRTSGDTWTLGWFFRFQGAGSFVKEPVSLD